jgi:hypothetical protein
MLKNTVTRAAATALTRTIEGAWFIAGTALVIAERALGTSKSAMRVVSSSVGALDPRLLDKHPERKQDTKEAASAGSSSSITEFFEPLEDLSDLTDSQDLAEATADTTEEDFDSAVVPALVQIAADDADTTVTSLLEELVDVYQETPENDPAEDDNAPF